MKDKLENRKINGDYFFPAITGILLLIIIITLVTLLNDIGKEQFMVYRVALALASGGFIAIVPGFFEIRFKGIIRAGGAIGVFTFVFLFTALEDTTAFDYTLFVEDENGEIPLRNNEKVLLKIGNERREELIDSKGCINLKNVPISQQGQICEMHIDIKGWQFQNKKQNVKIPLTGNNSTIIIIRDNSLSKLSGYVRNENSEFQSEAVVGVGDLFTKTNENGYFIIDIPLTLQKDEQKLTVHKKGYEIWEDYVYPATGQQVQVLLHKK